PRLTAHSTRKVAFELSGIRPFTVISPQASSSHASADDVTVAPGAHVAARVLRLAAHGTDRPSRLHERARALHEAGGLGACHVEPRAGWLLAARGRALFFLSFPSFPSFPFRILLLVVLLDALVGDDDDPPTVLLVAHSNGPHCPRRVDRLEQAEI